MVVICMLCGTGLLSTYMMATASTSSFILVLSYEAAIDFRCSGIAHGPVQQRVPPYVPCSPDRPLVRRPVHPSCGLRGAQDHGVRRGTEDAVPMRQHFCDDQLGPVWAVRPATGSAALQPP